MSNLLGLMTVLLLALVLVQLSLSSSSYLSEPQVTSLESGFENVKSSVLVSSPFFFLAVIFVLFDMELVLILPCLFFTSNLLMSKTVFFFFLLAFVYLTLLLEWMFYGLKWQS